MSELNKIEEVEVDALTDSELEEVSGGLLAASRSNCCSTSGCSNSGTSAS